MDYELLRNGSGYVDPTAYEALKNYREDEKTMYQFKRGEIYEVESFNSTEPRYGIIISANDREDNRYINLIITSHSQMWDSEIPIVCKGIYYANCEKVSLVHVDKIGNFIKLATDEEMALIDAGIARSLGIEPKVYLGIEPKEAPAAEPESNKAKKAEDEEAGYIKLTVAEFEEMVASKTEAELKAKIYKDLHEKLLDKVMQG